MTWIVLSASFISPYFPRTFRVQTRTKKFPTHNPYFSSPNRPSKTSYKPIKKEVSTIYDEYDYDYTYYPYDDEEFKTGREFELCCAKLLYYNGYTDVRLTGKSADHGVDILATKDNKLYAFQCKLRNKSSVPRSAVEEIFTGKALYGADEGVLITNSELTRPAYQDAMRLGITVWTTFYLRLLSDNIE